MLLLCRASPAAAALRATRACVERPNLSATSPGSLLPGRPQGRKQLASSTRPLLQRRAVAEEGVGADLVCSLLNVEVDNEESAKYTKLIVEVQQYPALLRTIAWTLNGLGVRVQNGYMHRDDDGFASQMYWLVDLAGKKLSDQAAYNVKESLGAFIQTCMPSTTETQTEWTNGDVFISNAAHDKYTVLLIKGEPKKSGFLLEISTVATAIGAVVHEARIQGDRDIPACCAAVEGHDFESKGRVFKFLLAEENGAKLSPGRVATVLYTLDLIAGKGYQPTTLAGK